MPKLVVTNPRLILDGYDLSDHCTSVSFGTIYDLVETTQMGDIAKKFVAGLEENTLSLELQQDFGVAQLESVIYPNRGLRVNCSIRPVDAPVSATNPQYSFQVLISEWAPLSASVGSLATTTVNWPIYGEITKTII